MKKLILSMTFVLLSAVPTFAAETQHHNIAVRGEAEMQLPPDYALIEVGVITQNKVVADALADNSSKMSRVIDALRALGLADKDIQTSDFTISPKYEKQVPGEYDEEALRPIIGYYVANHVTVTVRDMTKIAKIIDDSVQAGANASGKVDFRVRNLTEHLDKAREAAVANAQHKAQILTAAAHVSLGSVLSVTDNESNTYYNEHPRGGLVENVIVTGSRIETPILPGEITLNASVTIVYAVK